MKVYSWTFPSRLWVNVLDLHVNVNQWNSDAGLLV